MTDRAAFEQHFQLCSRQREQHRDGSYRDSSVQDKWMGWQARRELQEAALHGLLDHYVRLVESGDAGFWDAEKEPVVIAARQALAG